MAQQQWLIGRNLSFSIQGFNVNASTGEFVAGTNATVLQNGPVQFGVLERAALRIRNTVEEVSPMAWLGENNVVVKRGGTVELTQLLHTDPNYNTLANIAANCLYAQVWIVRGQKTWTYFGAIEGYEESYERGKTVGTLTLNVSGGSPPTYT